MMKLNDPKKLWSRAIYRWPKVDQVPRVCPRGPGKSFPMGNNLLSPQGKKEIPKLHHAPLGSSRFPGDRPTGSRRYIWCPIDIFSEKSILHLLAVTSNTACYWLLPFLAVSLACTTDDIRFLRVAWKFQVCAPLTPVVWTMIVFL